MNWINVAIIVCVIVGACLIAYLMWFMAHPRSPEQAQQEADDWAAKHRMRPAGRPAQLEDGAEVDAEDSARAD
jgi:hypothetical protein